jgi:hypothetical protein
MTGLAQVFSAWTRPTDDPLRIVSIAANCTPVSKLAAPFHTPGVEVQPARWYSIAAVKKGANLTLYLEGKPVGSCNVANRLEHAETCLRARRKPAVSRQRIPRRPLSPISPSTREP